jgi:hypothetical protein
VSEVGVLFAGRVHQLTSQLPHTPSADANSLLNFNGFNSGFSLVKWQFPNPRQSKMARIQLGISPNHQRRLIEKHSTHSKVDKCSVAAALVRV